MPEGLLLYDTMTGKMSPLTTRRSGRVDMFVCGPTVQGLMHMGHARTYVFYDVLARYLRHLGYGVRFIVNITDVDERITQAAEEEGASPMTVARRYEKYFLQDMKRLKIESVSSFERVSDYVQNAIEQIAALIESGHAYAVDGWVYFDTSTFPPFGRLSHQSKRELSLHPLELSLKKRNLLDFSLWRPESLVQGKWKSPWGMGSPGWHIQDTAITLSTLGASYDLHGGAYELIYPHHEAEIAQGESLTGESPLVRHWVHTHLVNKGGEKMSKSLGNVYTVRNALQKFTADEVRFFLLSHHYRVDMGLEGLGKAAEEFRLLASEARDLPEGPGGRVSAARMKPYLSPFFQAMNRDMDTPRSIAFLRRLLRTSHEAGGASADAIAASLRVVSDVLGIDFLGESN